MTLDGQEVGPEFGYPCAKRIGIERDATFCGPVFSPDGTRIAYVLGNQLSPLRAPVNVPLVELIAPTASMANPKGLGPQIAARQGPPFEVLLSRPIFSADGELSYTAWRTGTGFRAGATGSVIEVVGDTILTRPVPSRPNVGLSSTKIFGGSRTLGPAYSGDGRHVAYLVQVDGSLEEWLDGAPVRRTVLPKDGGAEMLTLSYDGRHLAYLQFDKGGSRMILDGVVVFDAPHPRNTEEFGSPRSLLLSADGAHFAFSQARGRRGVSILGMRVVLDGRPGPDVGWAEGLVLSPDGSQVAYVAGQGSGRLHGPHRVVLDERSSVPYSFVYEETLAFEDGRLRYVAVRGDRLVRVVAALAPPISPVPRQAAPQDDN
jgi:Tol biopolymer transport system component